VREHHPKADFPIFAKSSLSDNPVYKKLKNHVTGKIEWNFFKYLVNRDGIAVSLYTTQQDPFSFEKDIAALLADSVD